MLTFSKFIDLIALSIDLTTPAIDPVTYRIDKLVCMIKLLGIKTSLIHSANK